VAEPQSPCTGVCTLDRSSICVGCGRTLDEIAQWPAAGDARRQAIVQAARARRVEARRRKAAESVK
jgi:predicted Fe-S protein YdhL (DUF1289 family)